MAFTRLAVAVAVTAASALTGTAVASATAYAATTSPAHHTLAPGQTSHQTAGLRPAAGVSYSYWGFYEWNSGKHAWQFSQVGANDKKTAESRTGDVYGFRWALVVKTPRPPRAPGDFHAICGNQPTPAGQKRIAFVIDFGTPADSPTQQRPPAPRGLCAVVPTSATAQQALDSVASLRTNSTALICGIDGYPSSGCGEKISGATPPPPDHAVTLQLPGDRSAAHLAQGRDATSGGGSPPWPWVIVALVIVAALAIGGWVLRTRRA